MMLTVPLALKFAGLLNAKVYYSYARVIRRKVPSNSLETEVKDAALNNKIDLSAITRTNSLKASFQNEEHE
jgi:hypothetical protein